MGTSLNELTGRGIEAGTLAKIPVMVDFGTFRPERPFQDLVLSKLRPGDIYTHSYYDSVPLLDDKGRLLPYLFEARDTGEELGTFRWAHSRISPSFVSRRVCPVLSMPTVLAWPAIAGFCAS